jgi:hypothetical protein
MLSRLSSFSGPLSPLFKIPGGFTLNGLILRYVISDVDSYSGTTTVTDLQGNSDATLINGPTYSINGYLNFDGSNDYLVTNTSLISKLLPINTSKITSFFCWIYPQDNGVILTELGQSAIETGWHDTQIEIVSGTLKISVWNYTGGVITSSIATPLNNWYYIGLTYDGTTLKAYVNGSLAGSVVRSRSTPYNDGTVAQKNLHYSIGSGDSVTNLGDGTYAKMKFGDFHVYNTALSQQQILNNYNVTKNSYIYTGSMSIWIDANDPQSFSGGSISDLSGNGYTHSLTGTSSTIYGFKSFDCNPSNNYIRVNVTGPTLSSSGYTYVAWARIKSDSSTYRTLYRASPNDHPILVDINTDNLGFWDNDAVGSGFKDSGYDVTSIKEKWVQYSVVGDSSSSIFYINDVQVGSVSFGAGGNKHDYFGGLTGQPFGYVGNMMLYNKKLTQTEIKQNYDALKNVYKNGDFVTNNLILYYNPASFLSYPGSGTVVSNLVSNSLNGTMSNVTYNQTYFTFNGSNSQINISDSSSLEPGSGDWTMEVWIKPTSLSSPGQVVLGKFDPGGSSADISYAIRISSSNVRADFSNGVSAVVTSNYTLSLNTWVHLVYVFNNVTNNNITTYVNGASYSTKTHSFASILNTSANLYLGSYNGGEYSQYFTGQMGIVRLYNSALSDSDVSKNFEANRNIYRI